MKRKPKRGGRPPNVHGTMEPVPFKAYPEMVALWKRAAGQEKLARWMRDTLTQAAARELQETYDGPLG